MIDWLIIYNNLVNKADAKERKVYSKWLSKSFRHQRYSNMLKQYHESGGEFTPLSDEQIARNFNELRHKAPRVQTQKIRAEKRRRLLVAVSSSAAAIAILCVIIIPFSLDKNKNVAEADVQKILVPTLFIDGGDNIALKNDDRIENNHLVDKIDDQKISYLGKDSVSGISDTVIYNTLMVPSRYTYTIILGDSTEVHLNANSELRYPVRFTGETREVFLKGEGYFKVAKNKKPFIVRTDEISVKVYGTEFNISTSNRENIETLLISGSVGVTIKSQSKEEIPMVPNQKFTLNTVSRKSSVVCVDSDNDIAWRSGFFQCDKEKLSVMLDEIANWYGIELSYKNGNMKDIPVSVKLQKNTDISNILRVLGTISGTKIIKVGVDKYVIE